MKYGSIILYTSLQIPKDNFSLTAAKAIELWESHGSILTPNTDDCAKKMILWALYHFAMYM